MKTLAQFKRKIKKQLVKHRLCEIDLSSIEISELIKSLQSCKRKYKQYEKVTVEVDSYTYCAYPNTYVYGWQLETNEEYSKRVRHEYDIYKMSEEKDAKDYERLKSKYEEKK